MIRSRRWTIPSVFGALVAIAAALTVRAAWPPSDPLAVGVFVVGALTLILLGWYTYDTNQMARISHERWLREAVLGTTYSLELLAGDPAGRTLLKLVNSSALVVRAKVNCNFRIYGDPVSYGPVYDGTESWLLFPHQFSQGWFEVEALLNGKGQTIASMKNQRTDANAQIQLTMRLQLEFRDELGNRRVLPRRIHFFDFQRWAWIPSLTEAED